MRFLKTFSVSIVVIGLICYAAYSYYLYSLPPCARTLEYGVGEFDTKFGISEDYFRSRISEAEAVWEKSLGKDIFVYNPEAKFKINLVYDTRQANTDSKQKAEFGLTAVEDSFGKIDAEFNFLKNTYDTRAAVYDQASNEFEQAKAAYDEQIAYWNSRGGAPDKKYAELEAERQALNATASSLNEEASVLNVMAKEVNEALSRRNAAAADYNQIVREYNKKFGHGVEFNQAEYSGGAINVYQFTNGSDLRLALAHELGHSLGMDHVENESSIMYFLTKEGTGANLVLTPEDMAELGRVCAI